MHTYTHIYAYIYMCMCQWKQIWLLIMTELIQSSHYIIFYFADLKFFKIESQRKTIFLLFFFLLFCPFSHAAPHSAHLPPGCDYHVLGHTKSQTSYLPGFPSNLWKQLEGYLSAFTLIFFQEIPAYKILHLLKHGMLIT